MGTQENADAYSKMALIVQAALEQLLAPLERIRNPTQFLESTTAESFFQDFLIQADRFAEKSSQDFAMALRQFSIVPEVRGTPTAELAKKIRGTCFEKLDRILANYVAALKDLNLDPSVVGSQLAGSSVIDAALHGAAVGQLAGGFGRAGKSIGTFNAIWKGADELLKQGALAEQQLELLKRARQLPYEKIAEFLQAAAGLPEELMDYGCAKCFGGQVDFSRQSAALGTMHESCEGKLKKAIEVTTNLALAQQKQETQKAQEIRQVVETEAKSGGGGCLIVVGLGLAIVGIFSLTQEKEDFVPPIFMTLIGLLILGWGFSKLSSGAKAHEAHEAQFAENISSVKPQSASHYIHVNQRIMGPFTGDQLKDLLAVGTVSRDTPCTDGSPGAWQTVAAYIQDVGPSERPMGKGDGHLWYLTEGDKGYMPECDEAYKRKAKEWQERNWPDWLSKQLVFPFVATFDEDAGDACVSLDGAKVALSPGDKMQVLEMTDAVMNGNVIVKVSAKERVAYVPLADIEVEPESDPNFWPVMEYGVWFANCR